MGNRLFRPSDREDATKEYKNKRSARSHLEAGSVPIGCERVSAQRRITKVTSPQGWILGTVYKDAAGKERRKSHGTRAKGDAEGRHNTFLKELARPEIPSRPAVAWILDQYYDYICREKTTAKSGPMASNVGPLKEHLGHLFWDDVVQDTADEYVEWRVSKPRWTAHQSFEGQYGSTSRNTACKDLRVLRAALNRAKKNRHTSASADFSITEGDLVRDTKSWLTMEEIARMIEACEPRPINVNGKQIDRNLDREHIAAFLLISLATGARKEAILTLTWDQAYIPEASLPSEHKLPAVIEGEDGPYTLLPRPIYDDDGNAHYPKSARTLRSGDPMLNCGTGEHVAGAHIDFGEGNGKKRRPRIAVGQNFRLMQYLLFGGDRDQPYVISRNGKPIESLKHGLATVAKEAGVNKPVTHHTMKRSAITHMVRAGVPFQIIAEAVNTTEDILKKHYSMRRPDIELALGSALSID
jgi:integrase